MILEFKGRKVTDLEIDGIDMRDYPDFVDTFFSHAVWADTGVELTDQELEDLTNENGSTLNELAHEDAIYDPT